MFDLLRNPHRRHLLLTLASALGLAMYLSGATTSVFGFDLAMLVALAGGMPIYLESLRGVLRGKISADLAVTLAAIAALVIRQYAVAAEVILIMLIGESLEHFAIDRTRAGIEALLALRPHHARVRRDGHEHTIHTEEIRPDDVVLLRPGDRIPIDGRVLAGASSVDQSPITGESLPVDKAIGDTVFAGTMNQYGTLELAVQRLGHDTTLAQIIHLVEEAEAARAPSQRLADRYARWFVPLVILAALIVGLVTRDVVRSVAVLVVACPCALVLATPTAIAAGIGALVRRGLLIKGGEALERLGRLQAVVFDKTGTLTQARLHLEAIAPATGVSRADVLRLAAAVERSSEHPLGKLLVATAADEGCTLPEASAFLAAPGLGAEATVEGRRVRVGSPRYVGQAAGEMPAELAACLAEFGQRGCTVVFVACDERVIGAVAAADTVRVEARATIARLRELGIGRIVMLTGDQAPAAQAVADALGIDDVRSNLLPQDKVAAIRAIQRESGLTAMIGDGINDAPALAAADVGIAPAEIGTDVAIASADVVLMGDDLRKLPVAIATGRRTLRIIWQNILAFALVVNVLAVAAAALGWLSPVVAALLHQVSSLTVVLNSLRLLIDVDHLRQHAHEAWHELEHHGRQIAWTAAAMVAVAWLASGLHTVGVGEVGVVQQCGRFVQPLETPGLHYRLPWPLARHCIVRPQEIRCVEIGFRSVPGTAEEPPAYEWNVQHRGGRYERQEDEAAVWSGDENLLDVNLVLHYRVADPAAALFGIGPQTAEGANKWDTLVRAVGETALRSEMAGRPADALLNADRQGVAHAVLQRIRELLRSYGKAFAVEAICLGDVHPPLEVVPAFRDVTTAAEESESRINEAIGYQYKTQSLAQGRAAQQILAAEGWEQDRVQKAAGRADRFRETAAAYATAPEVTRLRLYLQTMDEALAGRRKVIVDHVPPGVRRMFYVGRRGAWPVPAVGDAPAEKTDLPGAKGP